MNDSIAFVPDVSSITCAFGFFDIIKIIHGVVIVTIPHINGDNRNKFRAFSWVVYQKEEQSNMEKEQRGNIAPSTIYITHGLIFVSSPFFIRRFSWQKLRDYGGTIVSSARFVYRPVDSLLLLVDEPQSCLQLLFTARDAYIVSRVRFYPVKAPRIFNILLTH